MLKASGRSHGKAKITGGEGLKLFSRFHKIKIAYEKNKNNDIFKKQKRKEIFFMKITQ